MQLSNNFSFVSAKLRCFYLLLLLWLPQQVIGQEFSITTVNSDSVKIFNVRVIAKIIAANPVLDSVLQPVRPPHGPIPGALPVPDNAKVSPEDVPTPKAPLDTTRRQSPTPQSLFPGLGDNNTSIPPDLGGAVGRNHVMTALNTQVAFQDKSGAFLTVPISLNAFWGTTGTFDPKVLYDPYNDRWIITACANAYSSNSTLLIAVSQTDDPTGFWNSYSIDVDNTNTTWFDYPSIGFCQDKIVVSGNMFSTSGPFTGSQTYVFLKSELYSGVPVPNIGRITAGTGSGGTFVPAITYDNNVTTMYLLQRWNGNSGGVGILNLYSLTGNGIYTFTTLGFVQIAQPWYTLNPSAPQLGSSNKIDNNDDRIQNLVYRNGSLWSTHAVALPAASPTRTSVQWWEINPLTRAVNQFGRIDDNTGATFYAFPSIAVNACNDVLIGYSCFSSTKFASAAYSFRAATDASNTLGTPVISRNGDAKYYKTFGGTNNRWGDYSSTMVDPDDLAFWTLQEYAAFPSGGYDRWGTEWTNVPPACPDLYVQDMPTDNGAEPNPAGGAYWVSDDIWVRNTNDGLLFLHQHQNPEYRLGTLNPNFVYVEVTNRGGSTSAGTEELHLYWAKAGVNLSWPSPWDVPGGVFWDPPFNTMLMGEEIFPTIGGTTPQTIGPLLSSQSVVFEFPWSPPDPQVYSGAFGLDKSHFCLLARITNSNSAPYGMTFPETSDLYSNVKNNNNVAWKNITVVDLLPGVQAPEYVTVGNFLKRKQQVRIQFGATENQAPDFLQYGTVKISIDDKLMEQLRVNGALLGFEVIGKNKLKLLSPGASFEKVLFEAGEYHNIGVHLTWNKGAKVDRDKTYRFDVTAFDVLDSKKGNHLLGGETFFVRHKKKHCWLWRLFSRKG